MCVGQLIDLIRNAFRQTGLTDGIPVIFEFAGLPVENL